MSGQKEAKEVIAGRDKGRETLIYLRDGLETILLNRPFIK